MYTITAYDKFVSKVNALDTSRGVNPDIRQFVFIFNEELQKWIDKTQHDDMGNIDIEGMQELYEPYKELGVLPPRAGVNYRSFKLPDNFFIRIGGHIIAAQEGCTARLHLEFTKPREEDIKMTSSYHRTSFDMEQALAFLAGNMLNVYNDDNVETNFRSALFSYYRLPAEIDMKGYINELGVPSTTKNTELSTFIMDKIIDRAATEFYIRNTDQIRTALATREN
jgi:hypothetical protein